MRFCVKCDRTMARNTVTGVVTFKCACGYIEKGDPIDARVAGATLSAAETIDMYQNLIRTAPFDRTNQLIKKDCAMCGRDYAVQLLVGISEVVIVKCKCGHEEGSSKIK